MTHFFAKRANEVEHCEFVTGGTWSGKYVGHDDRKIVSSCQRGKPPTAALSFFAGATVLFEELGGEPAVHAELVAGHVRARVRGEKEERADEVVRVGHPPERHPFRVLADELGVLAAQHAAR